MLPEWDARFPDRDQLRAEVQCLAACVRDQLLALIPADEIRGLYLKGSSVKAWESPLDYVPEVSDVDIHVWFRDDNSWRRHLDTVPQALEIQAGVEACFKDRIARPIHHPRLQLIVLNTLITGLEGLVHAPRSTVTVLHGEAYPKADYSDPDTIRRYNSADLVERAAWVEQMPLQIIDKPGIYAREGLRQLVWRVAPVGPLVLHVSGLDTEHVWSLNRPERQRRYGIWDSRIWRTTTVPFTWPLGTISCPSSSIPTPAAQPFWLRRACSPRAVNGGSGG